MQIDASALTQLAAEQRVPAHTLVSVVEDALNRVYAKTANAAEGARADLDVLTGSLTIRTPDGADVTPSDFDRLSALATKQAVVQWLRDVERIRRVGRWAGTEGTVVRGTVRPNQARNRRGESCWVLEATADAEGVMPAGEAIDGEVHDARPVALLVLAVNPDDRCGVRVTVSRRQPALVSALFTEVVPELVSGTVSVSAVARDPGSRSKVAAASATGIDAVAALVGDSAGRVRQVVHALGGEKVDVVRYSANLSEFVVAALTPARVLSATVTDPTRRMVSVTVAPDQLALALGQERANVKLAQRLTGARIEITTPH